MFDLGITLLPRSSVAAIMRQALQATAAACMRGFSAGGGLKAFNLHAIDKLSHNLLTVERFAGRCVCVDGCVWMGGGRCMCCCSVHVLLQVCC